MMKIFFRIAGLFFPLLALCGCFSVGDEARARYFLEKNDYDSAAGAATRALKENPSDAKALLWRGIALRAIGDRKGAERDLKQASSLKNPASAFFELGNLYGEMKRPEEMLAAYDSALKADPENFRIHIAVGAYHLFAGNDLKKARFYMEKAYRLAPENPFCVNNYARVLYASGEDVKALSLLKKAIRKSSLDTLPLELELLWILSASPDPKVRSAEKALPLLEKLNERYPFPGVLSALAQSCAANGEFSRAIRCTDLAIRRLEYIHALGNEKYRSFLFAQRAFYQEKISDLPMQLQNQRPFVITKY